MTFELVRSAQHTMVEGKIPTHCTKLSGVFILFVCATGLKAAEYWVATEGDDLWPGTSERPWRLIQTAATRAMPGDIIHVKAGVYSERVKTARGGTGESARIIFDAKGKVVMRGWVIQHPYVTVRGFDITGHSHPSSTEGYVRVDNTGAYFQLLFCNVRDGVALKREDFVFRAPNRIESPSGGFAGAGFLPGQTISVWRGTNVSVSNRLSYTITNVTDNAVTLVDQTIVDDGPKPAYITGSPNYGVYLSSGTRGCVLRGNRFSNLSYRFMFIQGFDHLVEGNVFEKNNGWDLIFWSGTNHIVRSNLFRELGWGVYEPSPDVFDNWPVRYENIHFAYNVVINMVGVINAQKRNATVSGPLYIRHNVFVDTGWLSIVMPNTVIEHNTFLRVAKHGNALVQVERHPLIIYSQDYATNVIIRNNVFVDCGQATGQATPEQVGWYRFVGPTNTAVIEGNFVAGGPPAFAAKIGWLESPFLNGGDPGFVNVADPFGPDGLAFTGDDGLRLRTDSKLLRAGAGMASIGAYTLPGGDIMGLGLELGENGQVHLRWLQTVWDWKLQAAPTPAGVWEFVNVSPVVGDGCLTVTLPASNAMRFFRLMRLPLGDHVRLSIQIVGRDLVLLKWPETILKWDLQSAPTPFGPWSDLAFQPNLADGFYTVTLLLEENSRYFRLVRRRWN